MELEYKQAYSYEALGDHGWFGVKVMVSMNREVAPAEERLMSRFSEELSRLHHRHSDMLCPKKTEARERELLRLRTCFESPVFIEEIPNDYDQDDLSKWIVATTCKGRIKIGWRRHVMNIDWSDSIVKATGKEIFPAEYDNRYITVGDYNIHTSDYATAKKYIDTILKYVPADINDRWIDIKNELPPLDTKVECIVAKDFGEDWKMMMIRHEHIWSFKTNGVDYITNILPYSWRLIS